MQGLSLFRSRAFWNPFACFVLVLALVGVLVDRQVCADLDARALAGLEAQLAETSALLAPWAAGRLTHPTLELQAEVQRLGADSLLRVTLVLPDGRVVADSDHDPARMENHGSRQEVLAAREHGTGLARRESRSLRGEELLYFARWLERDGRELGTLRIAWPLEGLLGRAAAARARLAWVLGGGLALALVLSLLLARRASAPVETLTRVAQSIRDGDLEASAPRLPQTDALGRLASTLRELGLEFHQRIATISQDDAQLRAMLAGMVEGVVAVDDEDHVLFSNGAARRLLRLDGDPRARKLWEQAPNAALEELIGAARRGRAAARGEIELHRAGRELVIQAHASPFEGGGRSGVVIVVHDVTDLRRLESIRRDFVANVSHELKTPLAAIKGFVETLLGGALRDEAHNERFLQRIDANVDRLTHLVTDLLSLARVESQEGVVQLHPVDWREVIESVVKRHADAAEGKGLELVLPPASARLVVLGDREAMTQVLENLVDNAIKYTAEGRVEIALEARTDEGVLRVRDTGLGVPPAELDRIFERFYRVDKARSRELGGTGLGLSIVKHLVLSMGGSVSVESELGRGSAFSVRLALAG